MKPTPLIAALTTLVLVLAAPVAVAQEPLDPALQHVDEKATSAQSDPAKFATEHASEEAVAAEAEWGVAYACYDLAWAHDEVGTPDPKLEQCEDYEEVLGIEPEEKKDEAVADVEELADDPIAQVDEVADDALATVEDIVEDPTSALDEILGFVARLVERIKDLIGGVGDAALDAASGLLGAGTAALELDAKLGSDMYQGVADTVGASGSAIEGLIGDSGKAVGDAGDAIGDGLGSVGDAVGSTVDGFVEFVASIFSKDDAGSERLEAPVDAGPADDAANDLLGTLGDVVGGVDDVVG